MDSMEKLQTSIAFVIENYDLDFNLGNAVMALITASYSENQSDELERAKLFIDRRLNILKNSHETGFCAKKEWRL